MAYPEIFGGVVPPLCTPFSADGDVDAASLQRLIEYQIAGGVTGIFALGSTSEAGAMNDAQRREVLDLTVRFVNGRVPVLAGAIAMSTGTVIDYAHMAEELGADAIVICAPYYIRPSQEEVLQHFRLAHAATTLPILAYHIPFNVQTVITSETILTLASEGIIAGVKDSSGDEVTFRANVAALAQYPHVAMFTGSELTVDYAMFAGADGVVPGLGNVDPAGYRRLYDAAIAGDWDAARAEQTRLTNLFAIIRQATPGRLGFTSGALGGFKTALRELGIIETNTMATPMMSMNDDESLRIRIILEEAGLL
ncbi:MAG: dihydrodipicolinate synthase family protein [Thermomicrobiales bacterium]|nr:dihydrodipicolinate synthase family protein [Thermomicrobiales bacterium]MCO5225490.1 dihydrodipicolinate synthase family protein [Thermomicrobiales bacterium]MCO5229078.1 dihydrodipicolinate synthase family protein [Thermomicrobiales bacterium]